MLCDEYVPGDTLYLPLVVEDEAEVRGRGQRRGEDASQPACRSCTHALGLMEVWYRAYEVHEGRL